MRNRLWTVALATSSVLLSQLPSLAHADTWDLDPAHSSITFAVKHLGVSTVRGSFSGIIGTGEYDEKDVQKSSVNIEVAAQSIQSGNAKRDEHLKSADFFDATAHPKIAFKSTKVEKKGKGFNLYGELTIKDITKPVTLKVEEMSKPVKDPYGNWTIAAAGGTKINRKDWGLNWNKALEAGGVLVGEEVSLQIEVEFNKRATPAVAADTTKKADEAKPAPAAPAKPEPGKKDTH